MTRPCEIGFVRQNSICLPSRFFPFSSPRLPSLRLRVFLSLTPLPSPFLLLRLSASSSACAWTPTLPLSIYYSSERCLVKRILILFLTFGRRRRPGYPPPSPGRPAGCLTPRAGRAPTPSMPASDSRGCGRDARRARQPPRTAQRSLLARRGMLRLGGQVVRGGPRMGRRTGTVPPRCLRGGLSPFSCRPDPDRLPLPGSSEGRRLGGVG